MNKDQFMEMRILIPVYLAYYAVGIKSSDCFVIASRILREYNNAKMDGERNAKIQELATITTKFVDEYEPVLRNKLSSAQTLLKQANDKDKNTRLRKRVSRLKNATAVTIRLRRKYPALTSDSEANSASSGSGNAEIGQPSNNGNETYDAEIQKVNSPQHKIEPSSILSVEGTSAGQDIPSDQPTSSSANGKASTGTPAAMQAPILAERQNGLPQINHSMSEQNNRISSRKFSQEPGLPVES